MSDRRSGSVSLAKVRVGECASSGCSYQLLFPRSLFESAQACRADGVRRGKREEATQMSLQLEGGVCHWCEQGVGAYVGEEYEELPPPTAG